MDLFVDFIRKWLLHLKCIWNVKGMTIIMITLKSKTYENWQKSLCRSFEKCRNKNDIEQCINIANLCFTAQWYIHQWFILRGSHNGNVFELARANRWQMGFVSKKIDAHLYFEYCKTNLLFKSS